MKQPVFPHDPRKVTLQEARDWLRPLARDKGARCPYRAREVKVYKRKLNAAMAYAAIVFVREFDTLEEWVHIPTFLKNRGHSGIIRSREWSKLTFFGLLEGRGDLREDGSSKSGHYRLLPLATEFVHRRATAPSFVLMYDYRKIGTSDQPVYIEAALGVKFNYDELMNTPAF